MKKILVSGTFDPPSVGHLSVIKKCLPIFDEVVVCIFINPDKKPTFSLEARREMLLCMCGEYENVKIDSYNGMLVDYARENGIYYIARGVRSANDFLYEKEMAEYNAKALNGLTTIFFASDEGEEEISSTLIRSEIQNGRDISRLVAPSVLSIIEREIKRNQK